MNAKESRWKQERLSNVAPVSDGISFIWTSERPFDTLRPKALLSDCQAVFGRIWLRQFSKSWLVFRFSISHLQDF